MTGTYHVGTEDEQKIRHRFPVSACGAGGLRLHVPGHRACKVSSPGSAPVVRNTTHVYYYHLMLVQSNAFPECALPEELQRHGMAHLRS